MDLNHGIGSSGVVGHDKTLFMYSSGCGEEVCMYESNKGSAIQIPGRVRDYRLMMICKDLRVVNKQRHVVSPRVVVSAFQRFFWAHALRDQSPVPKTWGGKAGSPTFKPSDNAPQDKHVFARDPPYWPAARGPTSSSGTGEADLPKLSLGPVARGNREQVESKAGSSVRASRMRLYRAYAGVSYDRVHASWRWPTT